MENKDSELVSTKEAARILNVTSQTILNMINDGRLKGVKLGNATSPWRINKESVMFYLKQANIGEGDERHTPTNDRV